MKTKLTQSDIAKIRARYDSKCQEFDKLTKEELDVKLKEKMSSTDRAALTDVYQYKLRQAYLEELKKQEEVKQVKSDIPEDGC